MVYYNNKCLILPDICDDFNFDSGLCECNTGYSTGLVCCADGEMRDLTNNAKNTTCIPITNNTDIADDC